MSPHPYDPSLNYGIVPPSVTTGLPSNGLTPGQLQRLDASSRVGNGMGSSIDGNGGAMMGQNQLGGGASVDYGLQASTSFGSTAALSSVQAAVPNMAILANLVRSGQISMEQFNLLASSAAGAPQQPQQPTSAQLQQKLFQQQQQQQLQQFQLQQSPQQQRLLLQQQQQQQATALANASPAASTSQLPPIPPAALQSHYGAIHLARNMHQKMLSLTASLTTGYIGANPAEGNPGVLMSQEQRDAVTRELSESK